jgi:hypothetical protein
MADNTSEPSGLEKGRRRSDWTTGAVSLIEPV